ncbi:hypothetical protein PR048_012247 [Dryococelus australis]|uniref:Uncharacterized protein n=1 Tax=Dryococelus australis TaxID=614101 RepID=A0ABQ9HPK0_9NEOP|nr:hypothetical protein PR048_012247 [Dryococelus australis]
MDFKMASLPLDQTEYLTGHLSKTSLAAKRLTPMPVLPVFKYKIRALPRFGGSYKHQPIASHCRQSIHPIEPDRGSQNSQTFKNNPELHTQQVDQFPRGRFPAEWSIFPYRVQFCKLLRIFASCCKTRYSQYIKAARATSDDGLITYNALMEASMFTKIPLFSADARRRRQGSDWLLLDASRRCVVNPAYGNDKPPQNPHVFAILPRNIPSQQYSLGDDAELGTAGPGTEPGSPKCESSGLPQLHFAQCVREWSRKFACRRADTSTTRKTSYCMHNTEGQRGGRMFWTHSYIDRNIKCRLFVAATQLKESHSKFIALHIMSKASYQHLVEMTVPALTEHNINMRECVSVEEILLITCTYPFQNERACKREQNVLSIFRISQTTLECWTASTSEQRNSITMVLKTLIINIFILLCKWRAAVHTDCLQVLSLFEVLNEPILCRYSQTVNHIKKTVYVLHNYGSYTHQRIYKRHNDLEEMFLFQERKILQNSTPNAFINYVANYVLSPRLRFDRLARVDVIVVRVISNHNRAVCDVPSNYGNESQNVWLRNLSTTEVAKQSYRLRSALRRCYTIPASVIACARSAVAAGIRVSVAPVMAFPALYGQISDQFDGDDWLDTATSLPTSLYPHLPPPSFTRTMCPEAIHPIAPIVNFSPPSQDVDD